ncbi:MAG: oxygen-independent coproporphyrinogen III oxidase [Planctomycetes bacterium]|nr:oxygen-independent coproporphyrinogen III oxidase [Planctomycetota bacterium]
MIQSTPPIVDEETFRRYSGISLPRHVSYPMPTWWSDATEADAEEMRRATERRDQPLDRSLYVHIPFCQALCKFCACCRVILRKTQPGAEERKNVYLDALIAEIRHLGTQPGADRPLRQIHWGGGTPTYLEIDDITRLVTATHEAFTVADDAEVSIEVDPRVTTVEQLSLLRTLGFNRVSLGVQDFDPQVQEHVKRIQPYEMVRDMVAACRELGFVSVNFDLIYGLPYQTIETIRDTLGRCMTLAPDRVAYYHYAQIPEKIATQVAIHHHMMPDSQTKLQMFLLGVQMFGEAGYDFIGLDHFARPDEMLAAAAREGTLQRNFQGMTTGADLDLLGVGASSISHLSQIGFLQNVREPNTFVEHMDTAGSAIHRRKPFTFDDCVRQAVISQIYCGARIVPAVIEARYDIDFAAYFERELGIMRDLERDGLVTVESGNNVQLTFPLGRVLMRNVAAVFDAYLDPEAYRTGEQHCFSVNA